MLTRKQNGVYRPLVKRAWLAHCERTGTSPNDRSAQDDWYRRQLLDAAGIYTTKEADPVVHFDLVMHRFAWIANDRYWLDRLATADERRALWRLRVTIRKARDQGLDISDAYVAGIQRNMGFGAKALEDLPAEHILRINAAVYLHARRHAKKGAARARV